MNKFEQLVEAIIDGKLTLRQIQVAVRASIRRRKDIPDEIKDLLGGRGDSYPGIIFHIFNLISQTIGTVELAYRRGADKDKIRKIAEEVIKENIPEKGDKQT